MQPKSVFENVYVVAKFFMSRAPDGAMHCISRTLGKFSIIDQSHDGQVKHKEIWVCKIVREIKPGQNHGAFILKPVEKVDPDKIRKIIPGFYDLEPVGRAALVTPNTDPGAYWVLSKATRAIFSKKYYAVVVPIQYEEKPSFAAESAEAPAEEAEIASTNSEDSGSGGSDSEVGE